MIGTLIISKKIYSLSQKKAVTKWIEKPFNAKEIKEPHDFEIRFVDANLKMEDLRDAFPELKLSWSDRADIRCEANKMCSSERGLTDIVWYSDKLKVAIIVDSHASSMNNIIVNAVSLDDLKKILGK